MFNMWEYIHRKSKLLKFYISSFFEHDFIANTSLEVAVREMHFLAYCYHWDRNTIWYLTISERKMWVKEVLEQKKAENKSINKGDNSPDTYAESY